MRTSPESRQQREEFLFSFFKNFYTNPANADKEISVLRANEALKTQYGHMVNNKRAYELRALAQAEARGKEARPMARPAASSATSPANVVLVEGTTDQLAWLETVLPRLGEIGSALKMAHRGEGFGVISR